MSRKRAQGSLQPNGCIGAENISYSRLTNQKIKLKPTFILILYHD